MSFFTPRRLVLALAIIAPLGVATATVGATEAVSETHFDASFSRYEVLPPAPEPTAGAIDMDLVEPAVEEIDATDLGTGVASYYGRKFDGRRTASGERFDMKDMTAAHRTLPFGSKVRVTNPSTGNSVVVRINDRGPFHKSRTIDVSRAAAEKLGLIARGHGTVELALLDS